MEGASLDLGSFELDSGTLLLTDPALAGDTPEDGGHHQAALEGARLGRWLVLVNEGEEAGEVESLIALHFDCVESELEWELDERPLRSESGYLGVFDLENYSGFAPAFDWMLVPHGFAHQTEPGAGFFDFGLARDGDEIVGVEVFLGPVEA